MDFQENNSPWLFQIKRIRPARTINKDSTTDIVVVGAGIAGVATAYFILRNTDKRVIVMEAGKVAHGATGHNAGQVVSYFERPFNDIVKEFGENMATAGLAEVESAWDLIELIYKETGIEVPLSQFTGYAGCTTVDQILQHLKNDIYRIKANLPRGPVIIDKAIIEKKLIPARYDGMYEVASSRKILNLLETDKKHYIAALGSRKGCLNSAHFTEDLFTVLLEKYPDRFEIFENTPADIVRLHKNNAEIVSGAHTITTGRVILCTNGFEKIKIENNHGVSINKEFHHMVKGSIGYMAAYRDIGDHPATATSYLPAENSDEDGAILDATPYYYLTRRIHYTGIEIEPGLISVGGPEKRIDDTTSYSNSHSFPDEARAAIDTFLQTTYRHAPAKQIRYAFLWHGLMGYTPNGIRRVGADPHNPILLYNLGCNGIGILPSIAGGERISKILRGDTLSPSIFDIPMHN